tara:strand:- start:238 stop:351 length:114 start_codon:yes stop_codon:yes gene_type:complete
MKDEINRNKIEMNGAEGSRIIPNLKEYKPYLNKSFPR